MFMISKEDFLPSTTIPDKSRGFTEAADRTSFAQMVKYQRAAAAVVMKDPSVGGSMSSVGAGSARTGANTGTIFMDLEAVSGCDRELSNIGWSSDFLCFHACFRADEIIQELALQDVSGFPGIKIYMQNPPSIRIGGMSSKAQYQYTLQDLNQSERQTTSPSISGKPRLANARKAFRT